ncbi:MAG: hypothetical protein AAFN92_08165 [Bacteroidota bacterium]
MKSLLSIALFLLGATLSAQSELPSPYRNQLTLTVGLNQGYLKDENFSPLHYSSGGLRLGLGYRRNTKNGDRWHAEIGAGLLKIRTNGKKVAFTNRYLIDLAVGYRKGISPADADKRFFVGGNYRTYVDLTLFDESEAVTFFGLHGFEVAADADWKTGKRQRLRAGLAVPVFAQLVRPPYTGWDKFIVDNADNIPRVLTRGTWTSLNAFTGLRAEFGWAYQASDRWTLEANYALAYYATQRLDPVRSLNNQFALKTTFNY